VAQVPAYLLNRQGLLNRLGNTEQGLASLMPQTAPTPAVPTLQDEFKTRRDTYRGILGDPAEQRNLTQAQMLFDIANTALAFSTAGSRPGMSPAERLAEAAVETKLFPTIAARSAAQQEQQQKFDLAALQSAETSLSAKQKAASDYQEALLKQKPDLYMVTMPGKKPRPVDGSTQFGRNILATATLTDGARVEGLSTFGSAGSKITTETRVATKPLTIRGQNIPVGETFEATDAEASKLDQTAFTKFEAGDRTTKPYTALFDLTTPDGRVVRKGQQFQATSSQVLDMDPNIFEEFAKENNYTSEPRLALKPLTIRGQPVPAGAQFNASDEEIKDLSATLFRDFKEADFATEQYVVQKPITVDGKEYLPGESIRLTNTQVAGLDDATAVLGYEQASKQSAYTPKKEFVYNGRTYSPGQQLSLMPSQVAQIQKENGLDVLEEFDTETGLVQDNYLLSDAFTLDDGKSLLPNQVVSLNQLQANQVPRNSIQKLRGTPTFTNYYFPVGPRAGETYQVKQIGDKLFDLTEGGALVDFSKPMYKGSLEMGENVTAADLKLIESQRKYGEKAEAESQKLLGARVAEQVTATPNVILSSGRPPNSADARLVYDMMTYMEIGSGPYSALRRALDDVFGGLSPFKGTQFFKESQKANDYIRFVDITYRVSAAQNPKLAEGEQVRLEPLGLTPDDIFSNPETGKDKLIRMKRSTQEKLAFNYKMLSEDGISDSTIRRQLEVQNLSLLALLHMLEGVPLLGVMSAEEEAMLDEKRQQIR
jgi:hypothetical protein